MKRNIWTYEPPDDVKSLMRKAINSRVDRKALKKNRHAARGMRTKILNAALRKYLAKLSGKREAGYGKN
jgi:uncharacterized protein (DUF4415 family)